MKCFIIHSGLIVMNEASDLIDRRARLTGARALVRFAVIGAVLLAVLGAFAYVGGWLSPHRLTQARMMAAFESAGGNHPGFRRNHAKGLCVTGWFESNGNAATLSKAAVFQPGRVPVIGRFALAGGMLFQADAPATVRSMALRILPPGGAEWRTGMNNIPVFAVNSAQGFYEQLLASKPDPASGKPNPAVMQDFLARHPETVRALTLIRARLISSSFADSAYNSLDAFRLVNAAGISVPVRWAMVPVQDVLPESGAQRTNTDKNYLFDELIARIQRQPQQWRLVLTIGQPGDQTADATLPWPGDRRHVDAGLVSIDHVSSEDASDGSCTDVNYDPLVLPSGIEPSDDPLLSARSAAYARSFTLRAGEKHEKAPSPVTAREVQAGAIR
jgi:catalase